MIATFDTFNQRRADEERRKAAAATLEQVRSGHLAMAKLFDARAALEQARADVEEGERRVAEQERLVSDLEAKGLPSDLAHGILAAFRNALVLQRSHLVRIETYAKAPHVS